MMKRLVEKWIKKMLTNLIDNAKISVMDDIWPMKCKCALSKFISKFTYQIKGGSLHFFFYVKTTIYLY